MNVSYAALLEESLREAETVTEETTVTVGQVELEFVLELMIEAIERLEHYAGRQGSTREDLRDFINRHGLKLVATV